MPFHVEFVLSPQMLIILFALLLPKVYNSFSVLFVSLTSQEEAEAGLKQKKVSTFSLVLCVCALKYD